MQLAQTVGSRGSVVGLDFAADQLSGAKQSPFLEQCTKAGQSEPWQERRSQCRLRMLVCPFTHLAAGAKTRLPNPTPLHLPSLTAAVAANREAALAPGDRSRVDWREGDALALPFEDSEFAAATCGYGLRNVADIPKCLSELLRVLKPGARCARWARLKLRLRLRSQPIPCSLRAMSSLDDFPCDCATL
jgi:SAM-dependent methyltransferase